MSGFRKAKSFEQIRVPMIVKCASDDDSHIVDVQVAHTFNIPSPQIREEYQRRLLKIKGKKVAQGSRSEASWFLWRNSVVSVEGYDDIGVLDSEGKWKSYFNDPIGRIHVDNVVDMLMETLGSTEVETEKNFEPSSEE
jgi:hypothetical protein